MVGGQFGPPASAHGEETVKHELLDCIALEVALSQTSKPERGVFTRHKLVQSASKAVEGNGLGAEGSLSQQLKLLLNLSAGKAPEILPLVELGFKESHGLVACEIRHPLFLSSLQNLLLLRVKIRL